MSLEPPEVASASRRRPLPALYLTSVLSDVYLAMLAINSDLCPTDDAPICKPLPEFKAVVNHNTGRFLMMAALQPVLSQSRNETVSDFSG